jgi:hypothetical protein
MHIPKHYVPPPYVPRHVPPISDQEFYHRIIVIIVMVVAWITPLLLLKIFKKSGGGEGGSGGPGRTPVALFIAWVVISSAAVILVFEYVLKP